MRKVNVRRAVFQTLAIAALSAAMQSFAWGQTYHIGEGDQGNVPKTEYKPDDASANTKDDVGAVRMARFSFLQGNVVWRTGPEGEWSKATLNMPVRQTGEVWVSDGGRAELQFDDGSLLRIGNGGVVKLKTLYSDAKGEFTEVEVTDGLVTLRSRTDHSVYQIDTPKGSVEATGPTEFRVGVGSDVEIGVKEGSATFNGPDSKLTVTAGKYLDIDSDTSAHALQSLPGADSWDRFNDERDAIAQKQDPNLPENMRYIQPDLDQYGKWRDDPEYGKVWSPNIDDPTWRPYYNGSWTWVEPFGWTWVSNEPWGWAPYHYGTWVHRGWGWAWVPGPAYQYWSPGVVDFCYDGGAVCWAPLAPWEVVYPGFFGIGFGFGDWCGFFSIGFVGWYGFDHGHFYGHHWNNGWANHGHFDGHGWNERGLAEHGYTPANSRFGTSRTTLAGFTRGEHNSAVGDGRSAFEHGKSLGASAGGHNLAGPAVKPAGDSWTANRSTTGTSREPASLNRSVYNGNSRVSEPSRSTGASTGTTRAAGSSWGDRINSMSPGERAAAARSSIGWSGSHSSGYEGARSALGWSGRSGSSAEGSERSSYRSGGFGESRGSSSQWRSSESSSRGSSSSSRGSSSGGGHFGGGGGGGHAGGGGGHGR